MNNMDEVLQAISIGLIVAYFLLSTNRVLKSIEICKECLVIFKHKAGIKDDKLSKLLHKSVYLIMWKAYRTINDNTNSIKYAKQILQIYRDTGEKLAEYNLSFALANMHFDQSKYAEARDLYEKSLLIGTEIGDKYREACCYVNLGAVYLNVGEYLKAREHLEKSLAINKEIGDREVAEEACYQNLAAVYISVGEYDKAREHIEKSLAISKEIGDRKGEASCYQNLAAVYRSVGEYDKAREHLGKSFAISKEIGDRKGEASCYVNLGAVYESVREYDKSREHIEKSLAIRKEIGDREGEASCYAKLGYVYRSVGEYDKSRQHIEKALAISKEIGDRKGEASCYVNLGDVYESVGEYDKSREHIENSLAISKEIGDREGEASCYGNLGCVYRAVGEYDKSREHIEKSLAIRKEIGDRHGVSCNYAQLGNVYRLVGEYEKAREHLLRSLALNKEIGDENIEASCCVSLGALYLSVGEEDNANKHFEKALVFYRKNGDKRGVFTCSHNLADSFCSLGKYLKASEYNKEALSIASEIGDRAGKARSLLMQGRIVFDSIGDCSKAKKYCEEAIAISKEIGHREMEANCYLNLGMVLFKNCEYVKAEEHFNNSLAISQDIGDVSGCSTSLEALARIRVQEQKNQEASSYLLTAIEKCEKLRDSLRNNDQWKISFSDSNISSYRDLCALLCQTGNCEPALYVSELGKARALADLMSTNYSVKNQVSANPQTWAGIESIMDRERNCSCLFVSYSSDIMYFWILKRSGVMHFRDIEGKELVAYEGSDKNLDGFFATKSFRSFGMLPTKPRKDESLNVIQGASKSYENDSHEGFRIGNEGKENQGPKMNLPLCYKLIIAPVADLLDCSEIIIVPDRFLYNIPFAALPDESGKTLSETFKIRVTPSLTTLRLIHDSPADYHSQTGALIVGNPDVSTVIFKGRLRTISRLPNVEEEAKMVGKKLGVEPLLGKQATKQAVLQAMDSVALIHLAAHGDAERGEIALAPPFIPNRRPRERDYLLTISDISQVQLRAKLVVLSCCHSARGEIKAEGAVGIARAFLGSGARSVLVSLWALEDSSTKQLMSHFYDHLVHGDSASDSLHQAMKWMRCNGYSDVKQWAPFVLIGDDVTFDFGEK